MSTTVNEKYDTTTGSYDTKYGVVVLPTLGGLSKKERAFLDLASKMAETSEVENRHGAVLVKNGRVLALGINKWRNKDLNCGREKYQAVLTTHAEIDALSRVANPEGAVLYIARVGLAGEARISRPCSRCMAVIEKLGIKRIIYTVD